MELKEKNGEKKQPTITASTFWWVHLFIYYILSLCSQSTTCDLRVNSILFTFSPPCSRICRRKWAFTAHNLEHDRPDGWKNCLPRSSLVPLVRTTSLSLVTLWPAILESEGIRARERPRFRWPSPKYIKGVFTFWKRADGEEKKKLEKRCVIGNLSLMRGNQQQSALCHLCRRNSLVAQVSPWLKVRSNLVQPLWEHPSSRLTFLSEIESDVNWIFSVYLTRVPCDKYK